MTTIESLETIWKRIKNCQLSEEFYAKIEPFTSDLLQRYGLSPFQSVITALAMDAECISMNEMAGYMGMARISMLKHEEKLNDMCRRRMLTRTTLSSRGRQCIGYSLSAQFQAALKTDAEFAPKPMSEYSLRDVCGEFLSKYEWVSREDIVDSEKFMRDFKEITDATPHVATVKTLDGLKVENNEWLLIWYIIANTYIHHQGNADEEDMANIIGELDAECLFARLSRNETTLQQEGMIEPAIHHGNTVEGTYCLSKKGYESLLPEVAPPQRDRNDMLMRNVIQPYAIVYKELFFNTKESKQITQLIDLLAPHNYTNIRNRMLAEGLRTSFCCLFHGGAGTGKTELARQLARNTNRGLYQVDLATLRDKYVGESEKMVRSIFTQYKKMVDNAHANNYNEPILFLNEGDAVLCSRTNPKDSVDKMENAMANIILEKMENLDGIMIVTTNLANNLDKAFERRFLYKVEFTPPSVATRAKIWRAMLPSLSTASVTALSQQYQLSGGQIENIARKYKIAYILQGENPSIEELNEMCIAEYLASPQQQKKIGFF